MTSLEHESNDTSVSASDYGADNWDQENWGEMDVSREHVFQILFNICIEKLNWERTFFHQ